MAPHAQFTIHDNGSLSTGPAVPAARHAHLFQDVKSKFQILFDLPDPISSSSSSTL